MNLRNFRTGLDILAKYYNDPDGYHLAAEHDQIFLYPTDKLVSHDHVKQLRELDWFQPVASGADGEYDFSEGWSCYV